MEPDSLEPLRDMDSGVEMSMEASVTSDDVIRAGGFGARDDIGCFLPAASDSTDFEASLREARDYEDPQEGTGRPGLGWTEVGNREIKNDDNMKNEEGECIQPELKAKRIQKEHSASLEDIAQLNEVNSISAENVVPGTSPVDMNVSVEMSMEASINSDDVIRAGGFGARDDIGCFLPAASDSTDFEASLRDARDYEDPQEGTARPGLGWTEVGNKE